MRYNIMAYKPSIAERARIALNVFRNGFPERRVSSLKTVPYAWPTWQDGKPQWNIYNLASYINEGFTLNALIYSAVMYKAKSAAIPPLKAYSGDLDQPETLKANNPLAQLVARPNSDMSWRELQMLSTIYLNVSGNSFVYLERASNKATPKSMWPLRPDRVFIIPGTGGIKGYAYIPEGRAIRDAFPILPQDMVHVKLPNPNDPYEGMGYGLSPISPMAQSADVDNMITRYIKLFFQNGAMPPGYLTYKSAMDVDDLRDAKTRWMEIYGGYENWAEIAVLDNSGEYKQAGLTFDQMGFDTLDYRNEERIAGPFGVPAALIGYRYGLENSGIQANIQELRRTFWEDTMLQELMLFQDELQYHLNTEAGEFVAYDLSEVPALQRNTPLLIDSAYKLWTMGMPANSALATLKVQTDPIPGGDVGYLPINVLPVGASPQPTASQVGQATAVEETRGAGGKGADEFAMALLKAVDRIIETYPKDDPRP